MTSLASFTTDFTTLLAKLKASGANLIVANIPDVTAIPYLTPASTIVSEIAAASGAPAASVATGLGLKTGDLVNPQGLTDAEAEVKTVQGGGKFTPLPDADVLTAAEVATTQATINAYNSSSSRRSPPSAAPLSTSTPTSPPRQPASPSTESPRTTPSSAASSPLMASTPPTPATP